MADREDSPDWLRSFQPPSRSITTLSSDSDASAPQSPTTDSSFQDDDFICNIKSSTNKQVPAKIREIKKHKQGVNQDDNHVKKEECFDKPIGTTARNHSVWALSSDSESDSNATMRDEANEESSFHQLAESVRKEDICDEEAAPKVFKRGKPPKKQLKLEKGKLKEKKVSSPVRFEDGVLSEKEAFGISPTLELSESIKEENKENDNEDSTSKVVRKRKSPKKRHVAEDIEPLDDNQAKEPIKMEEEVGDIGAVDKALPEKHSESHVGSSRLALVFPEKVSRSKALVECEGESIDLSGDMGAVGRIIIPETPSGEPEMFLDLKGTIYRTTIVPSRTFCVVSIGQSEAKIEAIMNDFIQLKPQANVYDAETMVEGTLEGFSFDSDDEADKTAKDVKADQNEEDVELTVKKAKGKAEKKLGVTQKKGKAAGGKQPKKRKPQATKKSKTKK